MLLFVAIVLTVVGLWKIPSTLEEARSPLAPYRALLGVIYLVLGFLYWIASRGYL